jgi:hypothetical protein
MPYTVTFVNEAPTGGQGPRTVYTDTTLPVDQPFLVVGAWDQANYVDGKARPLVLVAGAGLQIQGLKEIPNNVKSTHELRIDGHGNIYIKK